MIEGITTQRLFHNVEDYLQKMGKVIADKALSQKPLADDQTLPHPGLGDLTRTPLAAQLTTIMGIFNLLKTSRFGLLCSEMGTGKSFMSLAVIYLNWLRQGSPNGQSWMVLAPPHLVKNWCQEIFMTLPKDSVRVFMIGRMVDGKQDDPETGCYEVDLVGNEVITKNPGQNFSLQCLRSNRFFKEITQGETPKLCLWIGSRERMKLGPAWKPAAATRLRLSDEYLEMKRSGRLVLEIGISVGGHRLFRFQSTQKYIVSIPENEIVKLYWCDETGTPNGEPVRIGASPENILQDEGFVLVKFSKTKQYFKDKIIEVSVCPDSGEPVKVPKTVKGWNIWNVPKTTGDLSRKTKSALWQYDGKDIRRWAPGEYIVNHLKGRFFGLVADELHEYNGTESAQSQLLSRLIGATKMFLGLTGTLSNGNASSLWALMSRLAPERMNALGYGPADRTEGLKKFILTFGLMETVIKRKPEDGKTTKKRSESISTKEKPGIMPWFQTDPLTPNGPLLEYTAFLELNDVGNLPPMIEKIELVSPPKSLQEAASKIEEDFRSLFKTNRLLARKALVQLLNILTVYTDRPFGWSPVYVDGVQITSSENLGESEIYPKEQALIDLLQREISQQRKTIVYLHYINFGIIERLLEILKKQGIRAAYMPSTIAPVDRIAWFQNALRKNLPVVICNPECVKTGLNLTDWNTLVFYQSGRNIITNTQAERRCLRIGAKKEVRLFYLAYENTIQETTLSIMGLKKLALSSVQGKFSTEGIAGLAVDVTNVLVRKLVENGITEGAAEVWKRLRTFNQEQTDGRITEESLDRLFEWLVDWKNVEPQGGLWDFFEPNDECNLGL